MLEGLKNVDWHHLSHAYGPADDVPGLIETLALREQKKRKQAYYWLYANIYHQGTIYQASSYAVPFFIELLDEKTVRRKDLIVDLLATLAQGTSYLQVHQVYREEPVDQTKLAEELFWVEKTHEAVRTGLDTYLRLLKHKDIRVRLSTIHMLSLLQLDPSFLIPLLYAVYEKETDQRMKASVVKSLGVVARQDDNECQRVTQLITLGETPLIRLTAAIAVIEMSRDDTPRHAVELLLDAIAKPKPLAKLYEELPFTSWRLNYASLHILRSLSPVTAVFTIPRLIELLKDLGKTSKFEIDQLVETLLFLAFRESKVDENTTVEDLTIEQKLVLTSLLQSDILWKLGNNGGCVFYDYNHSIPQAGAEDEKLFEVTLTKSLNNLLRLGLPASRKSLRAFLKMEQCERDEIRIVVTKKKLPVKKLAKYNPHYTPKQLSSTLYISNSLTDGPRQPLKSRAGH